jgi:fatty-acyl-CoA synthase
LLPVLGRVAPEQKTVEHVIVEGDGDASGLARETVRYDELLDAEHGGFEWPELDERSASAMCYTTGTTGDPKGVVYSHRSTVLHTWGSMFSIGIKERDRVLPVVPMFHVNAWGLPFVSWFSGADLVLPSRHVQAEPLCRLIAAERVTWGAGVPTVWNDVLHHAEQTQVDISTLKTLVIGGSAVPRSLIRRYDEGFGVRVVQAWGMTETSPIAAVANPPKSASPDDDGDWRAKTGRGTPGVDFRIVSDDGETLPWDGVAVGEIEVRGPWITGAYYLMEAPEKFHDGWLKTGDVGTIDELGFIQITDRAKDVIKSGGEWISSVEVENTLMAHPCVAEAAVIGIPDERWDERPLACVVRRDEAPVEAAELREFLSDRLLRWWLPDRWTFVPEVPKTSVGKFDKKVLREMYNSGQLEVIEAGSPRREG